MRKYWPFLTLLLLGFAVYAQTLSFGMVHLDDSRFIFDNYSFNNNFSNIVRAFEENAFYPSGYSAYYRPLVVATFIFDAQLGGTSPFFYHLSNILLHIAASIALFVFFLKLRYKREIALFFALVFTVHPVLAGAVAWVPGRNETLLACFILTSFIFLIKYLESKKLKYLVWHLLLFTGALFTKELALVAPLFFIFYVYINKERLFSGRNRALLIGWGTLIILWYVASRTALENMRSLQIGKIASAIISNMQATFLYLGKMLLPFNLSVLPILKDSTILFGAVTLVIVGIALLRSKEKRGGYVLLGGLWTLFFLLPSFYTDDPSSVSIFMEQRTYLPMIGFMIILMEIDAVKKLVLYKKTLIAIGAGVVLLYAALSVHHSLHFKERLAFWRNAAYASPNLPKAHNGLGTALYVNGETEEAEAEYKKAIDLNPDEWLVHGNLGLLYMETGNLEKAEEEYKSTMAEDIFDLDDAVARLDLDFSEETPTVTESIHEKLNN